MCGLFGFKCFGEARPPKDVLVYGWKAQEPRGRDAAGVAWQSPDGEVMIHKTKGTVGTFLEAIEDEEWTRITASPYGLFHARAWTQGRPENPENNHPVDAYGWVVTHNGRVDNDDELFEHLKAKRIAEVDSVAINLVLAQSGEGEAAFGRSVHHLSVLGGSVTFAAASTEHPGRLLVGRLGGPALHWCYDQEGKILYWSSEANGLWGCPARGVGALDLRTVGTCADGAVYVLDPTGISHYEVTQRPFVPVTPVRTVTYLGHPALPPGPPPGPPTNLVCTPGVHSFPPSGPPTSVPAVVGGKLYNIQFLEAYGHGAFDRPSPWMHPRIDRYWTLDRQGFLELTREFPKGQCLHTPYGTYHYAADSGFRFKPIKRVRKWWEESGINNLALPTYGKEADEYNYILPLEHLNLIRKEGTATFGAMCPWCGNMQSMERWRHQGLRCNWCGITMHGLNCH